MKTRYLLISCFCFSTVILKAQPVLNSAEMLPFNTVCNYMHPNGFSIIDTNLQGANQTWNFQAITPDNGQGSFQITVLDPATTPYAANYPASNYCLKEVPGLTYNYYNLTATTWERLGSQDATDASHYSDTQEELVFPMQLGVTNHDTWISDGSSFPGICDLNCIGYGTLKLPNGTFSNALLVRTYIESGFLAFYVYFWYSADNGAVLFEYVPGDGIFILEDAIYLTSMSIGIEENEVPYQVYYNNPVDDKLYLSLVSSQNATMDYTVVNSLGDVLDHSTFRAGAQQTSKLELDFSRYASGIYFVRFGNESGSVENMKSIKVMKQ
jgi:hypothetical protein